MLKLKNAFKKRIDVARFSQELREFPLASELFVSVNEVKLAHERGTSYFQMGDAIKKNIPEEDVWNIAQETGLNFETVSSTGISFGSLVHELFFHAGRTNQWEILQRRLAEIQPSQNWAELVENAQGYFYLPGTDFPAFKEQPSYFQVGVLLDSYFSLHEIQEMISRMDGSYNWKQPPFHFYKFQFTAVAIIHAMNLQKLSLLVSLMKTQRLLVSVIQQFNYVEQSQHFPPQAEPNQLFLLTEAVKWDDFAPPPNNLHKLVQALKGTFSLIDLQEICQDAGLPYQDFTGRNKEERVNSLVRFIEFQEEATVKTFAAACYEKAPDAPWTELVGLSQSKLPDYRTLSKDGYRLGALRRMMRSCFPDNISLFEFVNLHLPYVRQALSIKLSIRENTVETIGSLYRRGQLNDFLKALESEFPNQFAQFGPYQIAP